jgi:hypothetical protein
MYLNEKPVLNKTGFFVVLKELYFNTSAVSMIFI